MAIAHFKLVLEYDGAAFAGWQVQREGQRTVQGELERALAELGHDLRLMGAGRTDAGVHALGQVASLRLDTPHDAVTLGRALNAKLPQEVVVQRCEPAARDFDARRDALGKHYRYQIWNGLLRAPLRAPRFLHVREPLDTLAMAAAAKALLGTHDFACFQAAGSDVPHTVRTLTRAELAGDAGGEIALDLEGNGFLRHMVRNIAGTLIEVGQARRAPEGMAELVASRDRSQAGPTAAAHGLTMVSVRYPEGGGQ
jgi:tRNA pseudouridine38-40 synthase